MGPISPAPTKGRGWHPAGEPRRVRATYHRTAGTRFWFGAYHVHGDRLFGLLMERKGGRPWLRFLKYFRGQFPANQRIYVIQDNLSAHTTPEVRRWARANRVSFVPTATNASWMSPIECRFTELQSLAFDGSDYRDWREVGGRSGGRSPTGIHTGFGSGKTPDYLCGCSTSDFYRAWASRF